MALTLLAGAALLPATARADQIFVTNNYIGTISEYTTSTGTTNPFLVMALGSPHGLAMSGANLFVANSNNTIGEYTTAGATVNPALITGLSGPYGLAVSGSNLFVANSNGTIGEYTTAGATVNASLISGLSTPYAMAVSGSDLFVVNLGNGTIGEYTTSGATVNASLVSGLSGPIGIAVSGSDLFVTNYFNGTIGEYTTSGAVVNAALISGLNSPLGITVSGSNLFVTSFYGGTIGEYTTSGATVNASLVTTLKGLFGIVLAPPVAWTATAGTGNWSDPTNWLGAVPSTAGSTANFDGTGTLAAVNVDSSQTLGCILLSGSTNYTISGSALTMDNTGGTGTDALISSSAGTQMIGSQIVTTAASNLDVTASGGSLNLSGGIDNTAGMVVTLTADGGTLSAGAIVNNGSIVVAGANAISLDALSGSGNLTMLGTGTLTLTAVNTYGGTTTISAGTVQTAVVAALPATTDLTVNGGTLDLNGFSQQVNSLSDGGVTTGIVTNSSSTSATLTVSSASSATSTIFGGTISGNLALTLTGAGILTLNGVNTYAGATTISGGTLQTGVPGCLPATTDVTVNGGTLNLQGSSQQVHSLSDGGVTTGIVTNSSGTSAILTVSSANAATSTTFGGTISGNLGLTLAGAGTLTLTGPNTYTGDTTIRGGSLLLSGNASLASGHIIVGDTALNASATLDVSGVTGGFKVINNQTLCGFGTVNGAVTINSGGHVAPGNGVAGIGTTTFSTSLTCNSGAVLDYDFGAKLAGHSFVAGASDLIALSANAANTLNFAAGNGTVTLNLASGAVNFTGSGSYELFSYANAAAVANFTAGDGVTTGSIFLGSGWSSLIGDTFTISNDTAAQGIFLDFSAPGGPVIVTATWTATSGAGNCSSGANWSSSPNAPSTAGSTANFDGTGTLAAVNVDAPQTVGTINLSGIVAYTISGAALTLDNTGGSGNASINSSTSTTQTISSQVVVANTNLNINSTGGGILALSGGIDDGLAAKVVTLNATGGSTIDTTGGTIVNNGTVQVTGSSSKVTTGAINGTGSVVQTGNTLIINADSSYAGGTTVTGGTLLANNGSGAVNSATGGGSVTLNSAMLGGYGTVAGAVILGSGSNTIYPSATISSTTSTGTLTVASLTTNGTTTLKFNLYEPLKTAPNGSDMLVVSGNGLLTLGAGTALSVSVDHTTGGPSTLGYYKIISYNSSFGGTVSNLTAPPSEDSGNVVYTLTTTQNLGFIDIHRGYLGDVDDSGFVDINDLAVLAIHWQTAGGWSQGNFLNDPVVDINDLSVLATHWQTGIAAFGEAADSLPGTSQSFQDAVASVVFGASQVPEPASLTLLGLGAVGLLVRRRRRDS